MWKKRKMKRTRKIKTKLIKQEGRGMKRVESHVRLTHALNIYKANENYFVFAKKA